MLRLPVAGAVAVVRRCGVAGNSGMVWLQRRSFFRHGNGDRNGRPAGSGRCQCYLDDTHAGDFDRQGSAAVSIIHIYYIHAGVSCMYPGCTTVNTTKDLIWQTDEHCMLSCYNQGTKAEQSSTACKT